MDGPDSSNNFAAGNINALACLRNDLEELKKKNSTTKVPKIGFSVGGWFDSNYFSVASSDKFRHNFAKSIARLVDTFNLDFIDFDWEYTTWEHCI